ncbi:glutamate--tRNA ligase [Coxiella endosymbiont of Dermacentor marginatus]|uniref:glutamate--tRNA ligase n=1 Tax=Coxiella endosymbiont of Dermacentor marginatus TaxID=1656159 RepID=UPI0022234169|nr:glutamate--tRNA ligase [Coxiella endosymbiont of Dermacentor marginatus]
MKNSEQIIRTRFAPSPTGYLHIGGARTALFSWLFAKQRQGTFILRIEDTDIGRSMQASVDAILEGLRWLQIDWDEGPYFQSQRMERYQEVIQYLVKKGKAYPCYCSKERLTELHNTQLKNKQKPRYDRFCRDKQSSAHNASDPFVMRFRNPIEGTVVFDDMIHGTISITNSELDDLIIVRSDGTPTYNFTVVIDDWDMKITHVIRGDDHINNTPRQINILNALDADLPRYAHVPMILGLDGKRLSKRHGAVSVLQYWDDGFLPDALINYLVRLSWAYGNQEIFSREEMINLFNINVVSHSPATFNPKKLLWLNQHYLKNQNPMLIMNAFAAQLIKLGIDYQRGPALEQVISLQAGRTKTLKEMAERSRYFFEDTIEYESKAAEKYLHLKIAKPLRLFRDRLAQLFSWEKELIHQTIIEVSEAYQLKLGQLAQPIRVAVTGDIVSPPIDATLYLIGRDLVLHRLDRAIDFLQIPVFFNKKRARLPI